MSEQMEEREQAKPSPIVCPDCGGAMTEQAEEGVMTFACHTGHRYTLDGLLEQQSEALERALWACLRMLKEKDYALKRMIERATSTGDSFSSFVRDQHSQITSHISALEDVLGIKGTRAQQEAED